MLMAGRIAEELAYDGKMNTGASNDIARASEIARKMVCEWGMSDRLGPISFGKETAEPFLGRDMTRQQNYSEHTAKSIDEEVERIVRAQYTRAKQLLQQHYKTLEVMSKELFEREVLTADEVKLVIDGRPLPPVKTPRPLGSRPAAPSTTTEGAGPRPSMSAPVFPVAEPTT
jgi:cell division protease FtsH